VFTKWCTSRFGRVDPDLLQYLGLPLELRFTGWKLIDAEHAGQDVGNLVPAQPPRIVWRHRGANSFGQVTHRQTIPIRQKRGACEWGASSTPVSAAPWHDWHSLA